MSIESLSQSIFKSPTGRPEYDSRYMHRIPDALAVDRVAAILNACRGKVVLDVGSTGSELDQAIRTVATKVYGIDKAGADFNIDLDAEPVPVLDDVQVVICGEVMEHLSNPGRFLDGLRNYRCPVLFTVPNAFSTIGRGHLANGWENVNGDHVAWYSWKTFTTLLNRHGFKVDSFFWYGGAPKTSEGLLFLARVQEG